MEWSKATDPTVILSTSRITPAGFSPWSSPVVRGPCSSHTEELDGLLSKDQANHHNYVDWGR